MRLGGQVRKNIMSPNCVSQVLGGQPVTELVIFSFSRRRACRSETTARWQCRTGRVCKSVRGALYKSPTCWSQQEEELLGYQDVHHMDNNPCPVCHGSWHPVPSQVEILTYGLSLKGTRAVCGTLLVI